MDDEDLPWDWPWGGNDAEAYVGNYMQTRSVQHLTLREVDEAKHYGLPADKYDELRELFASRQKEKIRGEVKEQVVNEVTKDIRAKLKTEIEKETRAACEAAFEKEQKAKLEQVIREEVRSELPNEKDVQAYRVFAREIEFDALAQAHAASGMADTTDAELAASKAWRTPAIYTNLLALPAIWYATWTHTTGATFYITLLAVVVASIAFLANAVSSHDALTKKSASLRKISSDFFTLGERAKKTRMVDLGAARSRGELRDVITSLSNSKSNMDEKFHPAATALDKARVEVRDQLATEMDPERFMDSIDEEETLRPRQAG